MPVATRKKAAQTRGAKSDQVPASLNGSASSGRAIPPKGTKPLSPGARVKRLTPAELEVVLCLAQGLSPKEIATERGTSIATVRTQIKKAKKKSEARTLTELVALVCLAGM